MPACPRRSAFNKSATVVRIFISYRRSDTQHLAGRIADRLRSDKDIDEVFLDVDGIAPGEEFETRIKKAIADSTVCLVLIGQNWLGLHDGATETRPRIFDDRDFIRLETRVALASGRKVVPVLVEEVAMPREQDLPEDLYNLLRLNAVSIRHLHFNQDMESLLDGLLGREMRADAPAMSPQRNLLSHLLRGVAGVCIAAIALVGIAFVHNVVTDGRALNESFGGSGQVWLLILGILALGALAPWLLHRLGKRG